MAELIAEAISMPRLTCLRPLRRFADSGIPGGLLSAGWQCAGGLAYYKHRFHQYLGRLLFRMFDSLDQSACCQLAHTSQRLANRRQPRHIEGRLIDVVKTDYRDVLGNFECGVAKCPNRAY